MTLVGTGLDGVVTCSDRLEVLFGELSELAGQRNAIDGKIVEIVAEIDRSGLCGMTGARSVAAFVAWKLGSSLANAHAIADTASRFEEFPRCTDALREGRNTRLPRFDKIADRRLPPSRWPVARDVDLVVFEGWFLKVPAQAPDALAEPLNALERDEDPDGTWRTWSNACLADSYPALWARLPWLLFLRGPGFGVVRDWRWQQEQTLQARHPGRRAMDHGQVLRFVDFFERTSRQALAALPRIAQCTNALDAARRPVAV